MITRATTANRPIDHNTDEIRSNQSMVTERTDTQKSQHSISAGFQSQTQRASVLSNPKSNSIETTESIPSTKATEFSRANSTNLVPNINKPTEIPTKTIRDKTDTHNDLNTSEKFASQDNLSGATSHQIHFQNTPTLPFLIVQRSTVTNV